MISQELLPVACQLVNACSRRGSAVARWPPVFDTCRRAWPPESAQTGRRVVTAACVGRRDHRHTGLGCLFGDRAAAKAHRCHCYIDVTQCWAILPLLNDHC